MKLENARSSWKAPLHEGDRASDGDAIIHANGIRHSLRLKLAADFLPRLRGLLAQPPLRTEPVIEALLITRCPSVHTLFMGYAIDVAYLDARGNVVRCVDRLVPWRASFGGRHAAYALELPAGSLARLGVCPGDRLDHPLFAKACCPPSSAPSSSD